MLFMGEEYGETNPFPYFVDHGDPALLEAVRRGRHAEFPHDAGAGEPPDPAASATFASARLGRARRREEPHASILDWHRRLLTLRWSRPALRLLGPAASTTQTFEAERVLHVVHQSVDDAIALVLGFGDARERVELELPGGSWTVLLDSHPEARGLDPVVEVSGDAFGLVVPPASVLILGSEPPA
jgi:maltooligosyltrehalose trehalohydrolase